MKPKDAHRDLLIVVSVLQSRLRLAALARGLELDVSGGNADARRMLALCDVLSPIVTALENLIPEPEIEP